jgi:hypothetical protein
VVLAEADVAVLEGAATGWARHGTRLHGLLVPSATAALEAFLGQDKDDHTGLSDSFTRLEALLNQGMVQ